MNLWVWGGLIAFTLLTWYKFANHRFIYNKTRPSVRYCAHCGQKQIEVHDGKFLRDIPITYWIDSGTVFDNNCHCHDYTNV